MGVIVSCYAGVAAMVGIEGEGQHYVQKWAYSLERLFSSITCNIPKSEKPLHNDIELDSCLIRIKRDSQSNVGNPFA
jgi:hypothetical protein